MNDVLSYLVEAIKKYKNDPTIGGLGKEMFTMHAQMGFPPSMFLIKINEHQELDILAKVYICADYQSRWLEHRRTAGVISEDKLKKIQQKNSSDIWKLIKTGEFGDY